jgi:predicted ribosomally synthesized peptide with nif11-like leader
MSNANITAFQEKVRQSPELQARLAKIQQQIARNTAEEIARIAQEIGTPFAAEDLLTDAELSDQELSGVAGGSHMTTITSREPAGNNLGNFWGLLGPNYRYTTADNNSFTSTNVYEIGTQRTKKGYPQTQLT